MDTRCFWGWSIFLIQNRSTIFGFVFLSRQLILLGCLSIHSDQFECRQKAKTKKPITIRYLIAQMKKVIDVFSGKWEFFQFDDFHLYNSTKNT